MKSWFQWFDQMVLKNLLLKKFSSNNFFKAKTKLKNNYFKIKNCSLKNNYPEKRAHSSLSLYIISSTKKLSHFKKIYKLVKIFRNQLPNIPENYIENLILNQNHELIILCKKKTDLRKMVGGCCYKIFKDLQIIELAFFCISGKYQKTGFGSILMNALKKRAKILRVNIIYTCADNNAVKFFMKQGFNKKIYIPYFYWIMQFKEYDEITMMCCPVVLDRKLPEFQIMKMEWYLKKLKYNQIDNLRRGGNSGKKYSLNFFQRVINNSEKSNNLHIRKKVCEKAKWIKIDQELESIIDFFKLTGNVFNILEPSHLVSHEFKETFVFSAQILDLRTIEERYRDKEIYHNPIILFQDLKRLVYWFSGKNNKFKTLSEELKLIEEKLRMVEKF